MEATINKNYGFVVVFCFWQGGFSDFFAKSSCLIKDNTKKFNGAMSIPLSLRHVEIES